MQTGVTVLQRAIDDGVGSRNLHLSKVPCTLPGSLQSVTVILFAPKGGLFSQKGI